METFNNIPIEENVKTKKDTLRNKLESKKADYRRHLKDSKDENLNEKQREESKRKASEYLDKIQQLKEILGEKDPRPFCKRCQDYHWREEGCETKLVTRVIQG